MARVNTAAQTTLTPPPFIAEPMTPKTMVPGGARLNVAAIPASDQVIVEADGNALVDATDMDVLALTGPIPEGTVLHFGPKKLAVLTADADEGDTNIDVEALATQIDDGDTATYAGTDPRRHIPAGTLVGRTLAERAAGTGFTLWDVADEEIFLTAFDVTDAVQNEDVELLRHGTLIYEDRLPNFDALPGGEVVLIRNLYQCIVSVGG